MGTMMDDWIHQGEQEGTARLTIKELQWRFGVLDEATQRCIRALSLAQLKKLNTALLEFSKSDDLVAWLQKQG